MFGLSVVGRDPERQISSQLCEVKSLAQRGAVLQLWILLHSIVLNNLNETEQAGVDQDRDQQEASEDATFGWNLFCASDV